ncbi:MAG TPA: tRNA (adenosine(37)-N6)-threonylcarbamoyltransferase complex ATPase subunit type 1 TsaE [Bacteroidales bacterium]|nr:tRNA (adenosine(37)-N6)-threonylcarbamoyltransferase complex ATPase subunit type 1 TsaE [Bacteroidales bacterium]HPR11824.1 tRNA (adenosine(37)-N6)-threonylcarbamoyltransferase complex ATPase subunit type 1 TsaE [Bacteroidales bacterium]HRW84027.1 tRNA (adenosine(37)-N6)-threonylcarbamoyltransferase complex ATPase subunit type 1 TsaE [Bacteroidales bacterium]
MMNIVIRNKREIPSAARKLLHYSAGKKIFAFNGPMGAGKTTIIKAVCSELGAEDIPVSPTFTIINEYRTHEGAPLFHIDLYRFKSTDEAYDIGIEEYLTGNTYCFIEWPSLISAMLPGERLWIDITVGDNDERILNIS